MTVVFERLQTSLMKMDPSNHTVMFAVPSTQLPLLQLYMQKL